MCDCSNGEFEVRNGKLYGEYDGDFHKYDNDSYSYCPICGEHLQPERLNPETPIPEWGEKAPLNFDEWRRRCDSLTSMET